MFDEFRPRALKTADFGSAQNTIQNSIIMSFDVFFGNQHLRVTSIEHQNDFCVTQLRMSIWTQKQEMFKKQQAQCSQKPFVSWHVSSHSQFVSGSQTQIRCVRSLPRKLEERLSSAKELTTIFCFLREDFNPGLPLVPLFWEAHELKSDKFSS